MFQGYDDNADADAPEEDDEEDDGTYADEEYGRKKTHRKKKLPTYPKPRRKSANCP